MTEEGPEEKSTQEERGAGRYEGLVMNVVPSSVTKEGSEAPRRAGNLWLLLIVVLAVIAGLGYGARQFFNVAPGREAQDRLQARVSELEVFRKAVVLSATYVAGDRLRVEFASAAGTDPSTLRQATIAVMRVLMQERPNRDLYIDGFAGDKQVVKAEYRAKGKLQLAGGGEQDDIRVRVSGEPEGGIGELVKPSRAAPR